MGILKAQVLEDGKRSGMLSFSGFTKESAADVVTLSNEALADFPWLSMDAISVEILGGIRIHFDVPEGIEFPVDYQLLNLDDIPIE